uniref:Uncharacterized protein n=1 Tax=Ciona savignyi TaxID=51511 RepID=H2ZMZ7_CIOSA
MNDPKQSRPAILRATSGSKSPGRTPTPPQRSGLFRTETLQALLKGKSPSHTANISSTETPSHPNSNVSTTTDDDIASKVSSKSTPPYPRRASFKDTNINLNRVEPVQTAPTTNSPSTPDDKLIIDDHTQADKFEQDQPVAKHNTTSSERVAPLAPPVIDTIPSDFTMSPTITDQCLPDDDLMNAAVS